MNELTTKAFKSGNSVALRLPKKLGIEAGTEMRIREEGGRFVLEPVKPAGKIDLTGIAGAIPDLTWVGSDGPEFDDLPRDWHLLGINLE